jgi:hypothetical protein
MTTRPLREDPPVTAHDELPLPDYDHLPLGGLTSRIRTLDAAGVRTVLEYERAHGDRLPVVTVLEQRLTSLREGAEPSGGDPAAATPEVEHAPQAGSKVEPKTQGPPQNSPTGGDPTNPTQPRR